MKRCPACQSTYADDSLRFCLQDGATLEHLSANTSDDYKTLVLPENATGRELPPTEKLNFGTGATASPRPSPPTSPHRPRDTNPVTEHAITGQPKTRSTASIVGLTALATVLLLGLGGFSAWLLLRDRTDNAQRNDNAGNVSQKGGGENQNKTLPNGNTRPAYNTNAASTPTPTPTPPSNTSAEERAVRAALDGWVSTFRARDIDGYMARYASVLDAYYLARNVSVERVRIDKERAFAKYTTIEVWLSDVRVQVDSSGERAVALFNKSYRFTGEGVNPYVGSGLNRFTFKKIGGQWLITGEEDLSR
ncbi:MAG TPA: nuclear transport factor 2 family protein [Pyrinomonadaceae bacterium]|nr:nuclear transport factor 2 family protein [Pyrinomonadaceae bacterium]